MHIDPKEKIAGVLISEVRKLLKSVDNELDWGKNFAKSLLGISPQNANRLLQELELRGYVERSRIIKRVQLYRKTLKGSSLGLASAAKPIARKTADRVFSEFMERVKKVNREPRFLMKVKKVVVFGSYLGDSPKLNDSDRFGYRYQCLENTLPIAWGLDGFDSHIIHLYRNLVG